MTVVYSVLTIIPVDVCSVSICLSIYPLYYANQWLIQDFLMGSANPSGRGYNILLPSANEVAER